MSIDRYRDFVFDPAALSEDVDLDLELRKEILFAEASLSQANHWTLLGVPWNAPAAAAKAAFLEKVKVFHPDRHAGRRLGSYRGRLERVFRQMSEAKDVLCDETRRAAYARISAPASEAAQIEARRAEDERRAEERRVRLLKQSPQLARAIRVSELLRRGKAALANGLFEQAETDLLEAHRLDPRALERALENDPELVRAERLLKKLRRGMHG